VGCEKKKPPRIRISGLLSRREMQELTTVGVRQRRRGLFLALALHGACADARGGIAGALAGLEDVVVLALSDWDGHAGITSGVSRFADFGGLRVLELVLLGLGLFSFEPVEHLEGEKAFWWWIEW
jgi:hypothetical protein